MLTQLSRLNYVLITCVAATLPFNLSFAFSNVKLNNIFMVLTAANAFLYIILAKEKPRRQLALMTILFISMYLLYCVGLLRTEDLKQGLFELEKKVGFILFPLLFYFSPGLTTKQTRNVLTAFCISCLATAIVCVSVAGYRYFAFDTTQYLSYHDLSQIAGMHAVYLSMYCCFSIAILTYLIRCANSISKARQFIVIATILFFSIFVVLLSGRTHIFVLILGAMAYSAYLVSKKHNIILALLAAAGIGVVILCTALLFPTSRERFKRAINYQGQYGLDREWGEQQMRPLIWDCVLKRFAEAPILGTGTGDVQADLQSCYVENDYVSLLIFEPQRFNAHNEFFELTLGLGLPGLALFLATLVLAFRHAIRNGNVLYGTFLAIIIISCMTESIFEKHQGVVFFTFFNALLFYQCDKLPRAFKNRWQTV